MALWRASGLNDCRNYVVGKNRAFSGVRAVATRTARVLAFSGELFISMNPAWEQRIGCGLR